MTGMQQSAVDWTVLESWLKDKGIAAGAIEDVAPIGGGTQNLMFSFVCDGKRFVLRRGPVHLRSTTNEAMRREAKVLAALADTPVPKPRLVAAETDETVLGAVFYLMEPVEGFNASVGLPELHGADEDIRRQMGFKVVDALAALGSVEPSEVGLDDFGHPEGFLDRQVPQWLRMLDKYAELDGYAGHQLPEVDALAEWLIANKPEEFTPGIMHGDFHLANLMFRNDGPEVAAIVDWEMSTVGDPLLDLGWLLATWPSGDVAASATSGALGHLGGLPTRAEIVQYYATVADRPVDNARWYTVMASFKLAVILEGTHARAGAGKAPKPVGDFLHSMAVALLTQAKRFTEEGL